jgi:transcriptional regulator with XRE-family HTH domain
LDPISIPPRVLAGDFAGWLRDAMAARGLSTRGLAARSGVDHSTIYRLATGTREPTLTAALALMKVLLPQRLSHGVALETQLGERAEPDTRS